MRRLRCVSALVPLLAAPIACGRAHDGVETRQAELDFETGNVKGTISWKGNPLDASESRDLYLFESGSVSTWTNDTSYLLEGVPEGTRTVGLYVNSCTGDPSAKIGETTFSLAPGATITSNFDLTTTAGRVTLTLLGNTVLDARLDIQGQVCTHTTYADEQGSFSRLLAPGSYRAELHSATVVFRSFTFNVDAGQTTDLGPIEIVGGNAQGAILWNKEPIAARDAIDLYLYEPESVSAWTSQPSYTLRELSPGTHVVELHVDSCIGFASSKIGEVTFDASPATNVTADFDLTSTAGRLNGSILSGGIAPANARVEIRATGCTNVAYVDSAGGFSRLLAPGAYWAEVHSFAGIIDSFPFLIEAGKTTEMGTIDVPTGDVQGTIRWKGNELDEGEARDLFLYESGAVSGWTSSATYELHGLLPGPHALGLYVDSCTGYTSAKLGQSSFGVVAGTTIAADFDLTSTAGQLTGSIRTNGAPFAYARLRIQPSEGCSHMVYADGDGQFSRILSPGSFTGEVFGPAGIIGSFGFAIHAGQTTNVDNFTTPPGKKVQTDLAGGVTAVGGLSLEFAFVKTGGSTSIVTSGSGPPPAPGYQVLGFKGDPMYWDLTTTARYEGAITVCIHYDETGITGNEMLLELHHDDGTGFKKVRNMELDAEADIVCGETDSLSPFVIVSRSPGPTRRRSSRSPRTCRSRRAVRPARPRPSRRPRRTRRTARPRRSARPPRGPRSPSGRRP